ncbi:alpha/beta fold hydrolase [Nonomuraea insulae]|uniref:Alpha/beta fold hydrolase n=1 Tax=Nonomuraea insulae TaxID=1616787 RepID=A0ABW1CN96_9ACTN
MAVNQPEAEEYRAPRSWWQRLQPQLTRYTLLPGAGHFPEWEAPDALAADLTEFAWSLRR